MSYIVCANGQTVEGGEEIVVHYRLAKCIKSRNHWIDFLCSSFAICGFLFNEVRSETISIWWNYFICVVAVPSIEIDRKERRESIDEDFKKLAIESATFLASVPVTQTVFGVWTSCKQVSSLLSTLEPCDRLSSNWFKRMQCRESHRRITIIYSKWIAVCRSGVCSHRHRHTIYSLRTVMSTWIFIALVRVNESDMCE